MNPEFSDLPESLLRLEALLEGAEDAMLLSELDGFLCCIAVSPTPIARDEWWPFEWAADERGVVKPGFEELEGMVDLHLADIERELAAGEYAPLFEVEEGEDGETEVVWQVWMAGFQQAMLLRFDAWDELLRDTGNDMRGEAAMGLASGLMLSDPDTRPDDTASEEDWVQYDTAIEAMPDILAQVAVMLYRLHRQN